MTKSAKIGSVAYHSDLRVTDNKKQDPVSYTIEDTNLLFPPENCVLSDMGEIELSKTEAQIELLHAGFNEIFNAAMLGQDSSKGQEMKARIESAKENIETTKRSIVVTRIRFQGDNYHIPLPYKFMVQSFNQARAGFHVEIHFNASAQKLSMLSSPVNSRFKKNKPTLG